MAIKFLPRHIAANAEECERFKIEAQAAAGLNHPNIATIHAIEEQDGEMFIVMEYIEGRELAELVAEKSPESHGQWDLDEILRLASQIAAGLQAAHAKGVTHRDIKSSNIMVTESGQVKIMDFGLAKVAGANVQLTKEHTTLGTAAYMSPEQARGEDIDHRTDIWSFGVVLYEMLTGQLPFGGAYEQAVIYSILNEEPQPIAEQRSHVPHELQNFVDKTLAKNRETRFQTAEAALHDLQNLATSMPAAKPGTKPRVDSVPKQPRPWLPAGIAAVALIAIATTLFALWPLQQRQAEQQVFHSIAVLPFSDLSPNKDQEYFCDGMTEEILTKLAQLQELKVIARTSVMQYKNTGKTIRQIGDELGVETVLEGSVRKAGDQIRVTAQLIKVDDESHLWANNYDRKLENIFALQEQVAKAIAEALHVRMTPQGVSALEKSVHANLTAYDLVMQGKFQQFNKFDLDRAMSLFDQALAIDSTYVPAIVAKAGAYHQRWVFSGFADMEALRRKRELAEMAVKLDPHDPEALPMLAHAYVTSFDEHADTIYEACKKALAHNPNSHWALEGTAFFFINTLGMFDQGVEYFKLAVERDPIGYIYYNLAGTYLTLLGRYAEAETMFAALRDRTKGNPYDPGDQVLLAVLKGELAMADSLMRQAEQFNVNLANSGKAYLLAARGQKEAALALEKNVIVYLLPGMQEAAFVALQSRANHPTRSQYQFMAHFPLFDPLRSDARFVALLAKERSKLEANVAKYRDLLVD